jgi:hypothetical protein
MSVLIVNDETYVCRIRETAIPQIIQKLNMWSFRENLCPFHGRVFMEGPKGALFLNHHA